MRTLQIPIVVRRFFRDGEGRDALNQFLEPLNFEVYNLICLS